MTVESEILSLLTALLRVSPEMLKAHRTEVIPALETIAERVGVTVIQNSSAASYRQTAAPDECSLQYAAYEESSSTSSISDGSAQQTSADLDTIEEVDSISSPASVSDGSLQQTSGDLDTIEEGDSTSSPSTLLKKGIRPRQLLDKIQENLEKIVKFFNHGSSDIIASFLASLAVEDDRLCDIKSIVGKNKPSHNDRYIQCLAQRSLALEYNQWELERQQAGGTRLDGVSKNASSARNKRGGNFTYYVQHVRQFDDSQTAYKALKRGIKQLMTEDKCGFPGIEVAIPFTYQYFDTLSYNELHTFASLLRQKMGILRTLKQASSWVEDGQSIYNGYRKNKRPHLELESSFPRTKRPRLAAPPISELPTWGPVEVDKNNPVYQLGVDDLSNRGVVESALDQTIDNEFVPRTTEPSAQPNISPVVVSGGSGNMDNHPLPHALGYNAPPESATTVELPTDHRRNLVEDTAQNAVGRPFSASLQLVPTTSTAETYLPYTDYWVTQPDDIGTSSAETYMPYTDYWATQPDDIGTSSAETYMPYTDYWATQPDDIGTSSAETYMPYTDYWATQPDDIGTSSAETYMPCTDSWVTQSGDLDTETHMFNTQLLTTTASQPQLNMVNIRGYGSVHSHGHNNESLQSHHTSSFRSEACNA
ncbi:hypothetical protein BDBG_08872 [Blastomyces gilchristii SLH14081]|uniref:Uncharacterized protein n=1 Tax=Blastomyces gilchristii (strain SLH14081) TaxID=559298 RepID=A0A179V111_BLAGS|nr:uncharacterized protein BDBG_08872 [Blastomyces gilchristii SLH14081]OAT13733.1 hypothetical protein BDBG_08872 [Blastomyces gilchristii SLH14081]